MDPAYFGLARDPFERDPDLDAACLPPSRSALLRELLADDRDAEAVSIVVGDPGVGKSAFAGILAATAGRDRDVTLVPVGDAPSALPAPRGRRLLVILDDAHRIRSDDLADVFRNRAGHLVLFGCEPLSETAALVADPASIHPHRMAPLTPDEAASALTARVAAAGGDADRLFTDSARRRLVEGTHGLASLLESIAARSLARAQHTGARRVDAEAVEHALAHAEDPRRAPARPAPPPAPDPAPPPPPQAPETVAPEQPRSRGRLGAIAVGLVVIAGAWLVLRPPEPGPPPAPPIPSPIHDAVARGGPADGPAEIPPEPPVEQPAVPSIHDPDPPPAPRAEPRPTLPPPVTAPPATAPPAPAAWVVQAGVFRSDSNARGVLRELRKLDPGARIESRDALFFVLSSPRDSEAAAVELERRLRAAGLSTYVRRWKSP